jgi:hypothetical protein
MRVHSSTVEDVFHIEGRGCIIVPGLLLDDSPCVQIGDPATLRRPDGTTIQTHIAGIEMLSPRSRDCMPVRLPNDVRKSDVPIGTFLEITETHIHDNDREQSQYKVGDRVSVVINHRNKTARHGTISSAIWHHEYSLWNYYLEDDDGRKIHKRYTSLDLIARDPDDETLHRSCGTGRN